MLVWNLMLQRKKRVGILGYGESGKYIVDCIFKDPTISDKLEVVSFNAIWFAIMRKLFPFSYLNFEAFVWNRTLETVQSDERLKSLLLEDITQFQSFSPDLSKLFIY